MKPIYLILSTLVLFSLASCNNEEVIFIKNTPVVDTTQVASTIGEKATFSIGAATSVSALNSTIYSNTLSANFTQITAEYEMKMARIWTGPNNYSWTAADALVTYAETHNMDVHGHTLVWYNSFPEWFKTANYDSAAFETNVKNYITAVVTRYKGRVKSWDVANEVFADGGGLRAEGTIKPVFQDPIAFYGRCFQYARAADPDAKLFYNDYSVVIDAGKRNAMKKMATRFAQEGYPIDGFGDQFHYRVSTDKNTIKTGFNDLASTGLLIHLSELDIIMNVNKLDNYEFTATEQEKQYTSYRFIVEMYEKLPAAQKFAITTWGVSDNSTWLTGWWHPKEYPLLFDANYQKKRAYYGFLDGLKK